MNKTVRNSLLVIVIAIVLFGIIWLVYDIIREQPVDANSVDTNLADENTGLDNIINELFDNVVTNEEQENTIQDDNTETNTSTNKNEEEPENTVSSQQTTESVTSKEERSIELVKKEWGGTDGVYFSNESIDTQGRYIVSVRDSGTTSLLAFFLVDVNTGLVTKQ